ncbi:DUF1444 family protein [Terracidiphilus gabretensis]|jgi:uncharacterized protein YtpQ (UPF0354 family)|uniref:DUF1444 family protein n=1 Tax=Terracidiphilus gabretensis TaxID=1577687 RepID=UPI00071C1098|nr:DUF1444 family protein [Terracidiphilus gabretensis]
MKFWPFDSKINIERPDSEPSTLERLTEQECTKDIFFLLYVKLLQENMPDSTIEFSGESVIRIVNSVGKESFSYLDNLWLKYSDGGEDRAELIKKHVRMVQNIGKSDPPIEKQNIVAMIKDSEYAKKIPGNGNTMAEHLCGDLWIVYAVDEPETIKTLSLESITAVGLEEDELRNLAVENLSRILPAAECHGGGPWYLLTAGADYVASLLLFNNIWEQVADMVSGNIVATVPTRDVLMFTGSESEEGLSGMRAKSQELCRTEPYSISESLIVRNAGKWVMFNLT